LQSPLAGQWHHDFALCNLHWRASGTTIFLNAVLLATLSLQRRPALARSPPQASVRPVSNSTGTPVTPRISRGWLAKSPLKLLFLEVRVHGPIFISASFKFALDRDHVTVSSNVGAKAASETVFPCLRCHVPQWLVVKMIGTNVSPRCKHRAALYLRVRPLSVYAVFCAWPSLGPEGH
jgi:hypothetical protein